MAYEQRHTAHTAHTAHTRAHTLTHTLARGAAKRIAHLNLWHCAYVVGANSQTANKKAKHPTPSSPLPWHPQTFSHSAGVF